MKKLLKLMAVLTIWVSLAIFAFPAQAFEISAVELLSFNQLIPFAVGGMIVNKANMDILFTAFNAAFTKGFTKTAPLWSRIATLVPSGTSEEKYGWLGDFPMLREWLGDRQVKNLELHDYSIKNKTFESTVAVSRDMIEDNTYGSKVISMEGLGDVSASHPDKLVFGLLKNGFTTICYDGQYFFDTDHPVKGQSVSNMQAGASDPWFLMQTTGALKSLIYQRRKQFRFISMTAIHDESVFMRNEFRYGVDGRANVGFGFWQTAFGSKAVLTQANFDSAIEQGMKLKSEEGEPLGITYDLLIVGSSNRSAARALLEKEQLASGESNTNFKAVELLVVPWLA